MLPPNIVARLVEINRDMDAAPHGGKAALVAAACAELKVSKPTLHRYLAQVAVRAGRKQRCDAGQWRLPGRRR